MAAVARAFPAALADGRIDRPALGALVFNDPSALRRLESILHPLVRGRERMFRRTAAARGAWVAVLDIPLLYEAGVARRCDYVAVVSAPAAVQRARVLRRPGMTEARYNAIVAQQIYYRFATGKTDDRRFEVMILGVRLLSRFAARVVDRSPL